MKNKSLENLGASLGPIVDKSSIHTQTPNRPQPLFFHTDFPPIPFNSATQ